MGGILFTHTVGDGELLLTVTEFWTVLMQHVNSENHTSTEYPNHFSTGFPGSISAGYVFVVMLIRRMPPPIFFERWHAQMSHIAMFVLSHYAATQTKKSSISCCSSESLTGACHQPSNLCALQLLCLRCLCFSFVFLHSDQPCCPRSNLAQAWFHLSSFFPSSFVSTCHSFWFLELADLHVYLLCQKSTNDHPQHGFIRFIIVPNFEFLLFYPMCAGCVQCKIAKIRPCY